jgi:23S rRNA (uracil747-C5)-methyltransferase
MDYPDQIIDKERRLTEALKDFSHPPFLVTVSSPTTHFRNKVKLSVTGTKENPILGILGETDLDQGRELLECPLHHSKINSYLPLLIQFIQLAKLEPYQISTKKGELKGIILFHSSGSQETYLRFVLRSKESISRIKKHSSFLKDFQSVSVNIQPVPHAVLEGEEEIFLTEKESIVHRLGKVSISLGPRAFVQTNQMIVEKLYGTAATWIDDLGHPRFLELFCGQGAFSFFCADSVEEGLGIEINPDAVKVANETASQFGLKHLQFKSADAGKVGNEIEDFRPDIILVNPPRRGLGEAVHLLMKNLPQTIIYSSCNYLTLSLDIKHLEKEYEITRTQIFDMFPHTSHFETLVELRRKLS